MSERRSAGYGSSTSVCTLFPQRCSSSSRLRSAWAAAAAPRQPSSGRFPSSSWCWARCPACNSPGSMSTGGDAIPNTIYKCALPSSLSLVLGLSIHQLWATSRAAVPGSMLERRSRALVVAFAIGYLGAVGFSPPSAWASTRSVRAGLPVYHSRRPCGLAISPRRHHPGCRGRPDRRYDERCAAGN